MRQTGIGLLLLLSALAASAAPPEKHQYIIKTKYLLAQPNASAPAPISDVVRAGGGHVDLEWIDRLVVTLPDTAVKAVAKHARTKYMQLVQRLGGAAQTISTLSLLDSAPASTAGPRYHARTNDTSTWESGTYAYDPSGNITGIGSDSFTYDELSRLTAATVSGHAETYAYDGFGNLTSKTTGSITTPLAADAQTNRLTGKTYDAAGNLTNTGGSASIAITYDAFNMPTRKDVDATPGEYYVYNANDERVAVINGCITGNCASGKVTISLREDGGRLTNQYDLAPYSAFGTTPWLWLENYVYRDGQLLGAERPLGEGGRRHFHLDHLGTPRLITGTNGVAVSAHDYYPFGVEITPLRQETLAGYDREEPMKFTGHERDFNIGTTTENENYDDYMHARSTFAVWGRFYSVDPSVKPDDAVPRPQSWNGYSYSASNPLRYVDPDGRSPVDAANGFLNALFSDFGVWFRWSQGNSDYQIGQYRGDQAALAAGSILALAGPSVSGGITLATAGAGAITVPAGLAMSAYGIGVAANAGQHLAEAELPRSSGSEPEVDVDKLKRLSDKQIRDLGGEELTRELKAYTGKSRANLYLDPRTGRIYSMTKGGQPQWVWTISVAK